MYGAHTGHGLRNKYLESGSADGMDASHTGSRGLILVGSTSKKDGKWQH